MLTKIIRPLLRPATTLVALSFAWRFSFELAAAPTAAALAVAYLAAPAPWRAHLHAAARALGRRMQAEWPRLSYLAEPVNVSASVSSLRARCSRSQRTETPSVTPTPIETSPPIETFALDPALRASLWLPGDPR